MSVFLTIVVMETQQYVTLYCCWLTCSCELYTTVGSWNGSNNGFTSHCRRDIDYFEVLSI